MKWTQYVRSELGILKTNFSKCLFIYMHGCYSDVLVV